MEIVFIPIARFLGYSSEIACVGFRKIVPGCSKRDRRKTGQLNVSSSGPAARGNYFPESETTKRETLHWSIWSSIVKPNKNETSHNEVEMKSGDDQKHRTLAAEFLKTQRFAVVATIFDGEPQAATVAFSARYDFEIIFGTYYTTRKYRNLKQNPKVAVVVGWDESVTVQMEGSAEELHGELLEECKRIHVEKNPSSAVYANMEENRYFKVQPNWVRYTDISALPEFVVEIKV